MLHDWAKMDDTAITKVQDIALIFDLLLHHTYITLSHISKVTDDFHNILALTKKQ